MHKIAPVAGLAVLLMGAVAPAWAGDISCAWDNLPAAVRAEFEQLARSPQPEKALYLIDHPSMASAIMACKFPTAPPDRLVLAMSGLLGQRLAELHLAGQLAPDQLDAAWSRVDGALVAAALATWARGFDPKASAAVAEDLARQLNLPATGDARTRALIWAYAIKRIERVYGEAGF